MTLFPALDQPVTRFLFFNKLLFSITNKDNNTFLPFTGAVYVSQLLNLVLFCFSFFISINLIFDATVESPDVHTVFEQVGTPTQCPQNASTVTMFLSITVTVRMFIVFGIFLLLLSLQIDLALSSKLSHEKNSQGGMQDVHYHDYGFTVLLGLYL